MLDISPILFVVLGTAALLGFALGYALARWLPDERHASVLGELEARHLAAEQESAARVDVLSTALEREREGVARNRRRWSERELSQASRQETLEAQAKTQQNRIKDLLCEQRSTEERLMRVEQRLATLRQEYGMAERDRSAVMPERPFSGATARSLQSQLDGVTGRGLEQCPRCCFKADVAPLVPHRSEGVAESSDAAAPGAGQSHPRWSNRAGLPAAVLSLSRFRTGCGSQHCGAGLPASR